MLLKDSPMQAHTEALIKNHTEALIKDGVPIGSTGSKATLETLYGSSAAERVVTTAGGWNEAGLAKVDTRNLLPALGVEALETKGADKALSSLPNVEILSGDISRMKADALITPVNSGGMWFGALDGVIQRAGGNQFHKQAMAAMPLVDGQTVVAQKLVEHKGAFGPVVFVVDDLQKPLRDVVSAGLKAADEAGFKSVSLPAMRTGVMMGVVEKTAQATVDEMAAGVRAFAEAGPKSIKNIKFGVYNNPDIEERLFKALADK
jgi:O-acetyl-ADP-ribose deacetylase (regulator of RNase III)